ncbi:MAG: helix-turn-helix transcriptional regulator [Acutalibacter muris]|nr:helix-turn-helix transcriptional regulator [Acutalibacter muris]MCI9543025.1 helix-turn-helix transcriptional regulator [Acutalibacter muris]
MPVDPIKVGRHIHALRRARNLTQNQLGELLHISFQAVSKWERGETLPDVNLLPDLAEVLSTTVDNILNGGERPMKTPEQYTRTATIAQMREGIDCFERIGELLGKDGFFYKGAIGGVNLKMNTDLEEGLADDYLRECFIAEAAIQAMMDGAYFSPEDIEHGFVHEHWRDVLKEYAKKYGIE